MLKVRHISSRAEYAEALAEIARDFPREPDPGHHDRAAFDALADAIEAYGADDTTEVSSDPSLSRAHRARACGAGFDGAHYPSLAFGEAILRLRRAEALYARQRALVEKLRDEGRDAARAERCLHTCGRTLAAARRLRELTCAELLRQHEVRFGQLG